jgi:hypothetical protein
VRLGLGELNLATALRCLFSNVGGFAAVAPPKTMAEDIDVVVATELVVAVDVFFCYCAITGCHLLLVIVRMVC